MQKKENNTDDLNVRQIIEQYAYYWRWFLFSFLIIIGIALLYIFFATKKYETTAKIVLNKEGASSPAMDLLSGAGSMFGSGGSQISDEIEIIGSRRIFSKVVEKHNMNISYYLHNGFPKTEVLSYNSPIEIGFTEESVRYQENFNGLLEVELLSNNSFYVKSDDLVKEGTYQFGTPISSEIGSLIIKRNPQFKPPKEKKITHVSVALRPFMQTVENYIKKTKIEPGKDKQSLIINFSLTDNIRERSDNVINDIIFIYNQDKKEDENKLAIATSDFISTRLEIIGKDLEGVDKDLEQFKISNQVNNAQLEAGAFFEEALGSDAQIVSIRTQIEIAKQLIINLKEDENALLPSNVGISDQGLNTAINNYNQLVLSSQDLSKSATSNNIMLENLNSNIEDLKKSIQSSLNIYQNNLQTQLRALESKNKEFETRLSKLPQHEKGFRSIARQQQIVESIYLFLLQKREESEIKVAANVDSFKIIDKAYSNPVPVAPRKFVVLFIAIVLGVLIPLVLVYIKLALDNKVKDKSDIEKEFAGTILGDIPKTKTSIIKGNDRSALAEAFRILRSSLSFILPAEEKAKVIFVTSTTAGEGKTFTSSNLAQIQGLAEKKVVLIGADIRKPRIMSSLGLSEYDSNRGLSDLLANNTLEIKEVLIKTPGDYKFDIIPAGTLPPNPSELLMSKRFGDLLEQLKWAYDYIIVDTAPVALVTDTQIIARYADVTVYVMRANYLDKRLLGVLKDHYEKNKLKNIAVVINDLDHQRGYGYGSSYGYGYGEENQKKNIFQRIFSKR